MNHEKMIKDWIGEDEMRMDALRMARELKLNDWWLAAGFIRSLIWDKLHDYEKSTKLQDIDLIYFDPEKCNPEIDADMEIRLKSSSEYPWSVKNQAYMHLRNNDQPYKSSTDAMTYWVELQTAIGANLSDIGEINIIAPFGLEILFDFSITLNEKRPKPAVFEKRIAEKKWLKNWPKLHLSGY